MTMFFCVVSMFYPSRGMPPDPPRRLVLRTAHGVLCTPIKSPPSYMHDHAILQMANQISVWLAILSAQIFFLILYTASYSLPVHNHEGAHWGTLYLLTDDLCGNELEIPGRWRFIFQLSDNISIQILRFTINLYLFCNLLLHLWIIKWNIKSAPSVKS